MLFVRLLQRAVLKLAWLSLVKKYSGKKDVRKMTRKNKTALKNLKLIHFLVFIVLLMLMRWLEIL